MVGPRPSFEELLNFRDVATTVNSGVTSSSLKPGQLYRSARPDLTSDHDKKTLRDQVGISTIIDLRSKTEHLEADQKFEQRQRQSDVSETTIPRQIPGVSYAEVNLNGRGFERHLVWQLSYWNLALVIVYMVLGYRIAAISIIGQNVLQPRGLLGLGKDTIEHSGPEIKRVFDVLGQKNAYPVLVHCTQGKDRTGLIVLLVLLLCGVDVHSISADYMLSETELEPEFKERMKEISSIGLNESFARCPSNFVETLTSFITERYGGVEEYLGTIGVERSTIDTIRSQLCF